LGAGDLGKTGAGHQAGGKNQSGGGKFYVHFGCFQKCSDMSKWVTSPVLV
jgi:hypothetical protein